MTETKDLAAQMQIINEQLNPLIERAERALAGLKFGVIGAVEFEDGFLCFGKIEGEWRLYVARQGQERLLRSMSRAARLKALSMLPELAVELEATTGAKLYDCEKILEEARTYLDHLESRA